MRPQTHPRPSCSSRRWRSRSQLKRYRRHLSTTKSLLLFSALVRVPPVALVIFGLCILAVPPAEVRSAATDRLLALPTEYGNIFLRDGRPVVREINGYQGAGAGEPGQAALGGLAPGVAALTSAPPFP